MIEEIDAKLKEEANKLIAKKTLTKDDILVLIQIKNEFKFVEELKKMIDFAS